MKEKNQDKVNKNKKPQNKIKIIKIKNKGKINKKEK